MLNCMLLLYVLLLPFAVNKSVSQVIFGVFQRRRLAPKIIAWH